MPALRQPAGIVQMPGRMLMVRMIYFSLIITLATMLTALVISIQPARASSESVSFRDQFIDTSLRSALASSPTQTITLTTTIYLPMVEMHQPLPVKEPGFKPGAGTLFCSSFGSPINIPDNLMTGITNTITIPDSKFIADLNVYLNIDHSWVGDLVVNLTHLSPDTGVTTITLLNRPGYPAIKDGCAGSNIVTILDDDSPLAAHDWCGGVSPVSYVQMPAISGIFSAYTPLTTFIGEGIAGDWSLNISDQNHANVGSLNNWCLDVDLTDIPYSPPLPPLPLELPAYAQVSGISGVGQALPLDCEIRSAVDFAAFFGHYINELSFLDGFPITNNRVPFTDNPDLGFVGNVYGQWGQTPPGPYGVHAKPIAERLINYGVEAHYYRRLSWDNIRSEIAQNRPVIVWVPGAVHTSIPVYYTSSDGKTTLVAPYEHTVMVVGYSPDRVWFQDGYNRYDRSLAEFLNAWSSMRFMAVMAR